jgi:ubiquinone/menaquinone biosynthesis C-methylase UbiE
MHSAARHRHRPSGTAASTETKGLIMKGGWRYDLHGWFLDACWFRGQGRKLRKQALTLARLQPGDIVLDVGCGTGTLALEAQRAVGTAGRVYGRVSGRVYGIDPGEEQIARARSKAALRRLPVEFQVGVIEQLPFPDATFDVVFSTLMMHHLPAPLKGQGLAEIARVLKPRGRLVIADFTRKQDRAGRAERFHAGGSSLQELATLVRDSGFEHLETQEMAPARFSAFPGAGLIRAGKSAR